MPWAPTVAHSATARRGLLHGSDYPLPGVGPLYRLKTLVRAGVLEAAHVPVLEQVREFNPLLFDFMLRRLARWQGKGLADCVFATRRLFVHK